MYNHNLSDGFSTPFLTINEYGIYLLVVVYYFPKEPTNVPGRRRSEGPAIVQRVDELLLAETEDSS